MECLEQFLKDLFLASDGDRLHRGVVFAVNRVTVMEATDQLGGRSNLITMVQIQGNQRDFEIAERLAGQVDALLWVVDPQKYADDVLHAQFIAPHARHAAVTLLALNQVDLLSPADRGPVVASLQGIIERDGLPRARVLPVSARTGEGVEALRAEDYANAAARFTASLEASPEAKAAGATGWLVKPVEPEQLLGVVKQLVPTA